MEFCRRCGTPYEVEWMKGVYVSEAPILSTPKHFNSTEKNCYEYGCTDDCTARELPDPDDESTWSTAVLPKCRPNWFVRAVEAGLMEAVILTVVVAGAIRFIFF